MGRGGQSEFDLLTRRSGKESPSPSMRSTGGASSSLGFYKQKETGNKYGVINEENLENMVEAADMPPFLDTMIETERDRTLAIRKELNELQNVASAKERELKGLKRQHAVANIEFGLESDFSAAVNSAADLEDSDSESGFTSRSHSVAPSELGAGRPTDEMRKEQLSMQIARLTEKTNIVTAYLQILEYLEKREWNLWQQSKSDAANIQVEVDEATKPRAEEASLAQGDAYATVASIREAMVELICNLEHQMSMLNRRREVSREVNESAGLEGPTISRELRQLLQDREYLIRHIHCLRGSHMEELQEKRAAVREAVLASADKKRSLPALPSAPTPSPLPLSALKTVNLLSSKTPMAGGLLAALKGTPSTADSSKRETPTPTSASPAKDTPGSDNAPRGRRQTQYGEFSKQYKEKQERKHKIAKRKTIARQMELRDVAKQTEVKANISSMETVARIERSRSEYEHLRDTFEKIRETTGVSYQEPDKIVGMLTGQKTAAMLKDVDDRRFKVEDLQNAFHKATSEYDHLLCFGESNNMVQGMLDDMDSKVTASSQKQEQVGERYQRLNHVLRTAVFGMSALNDKVAVVGTPVLAALQEGGQLPNGAALSEDKVQAMLQRTQSMGKKKGGFQAAVSRAASRGKGSVEEWEGPQWSPSSSLELGGKLAQRDVTLGDVQALLESISLLLSVLMEAVPEAKRTPMKAHTVVLGGIESAAPWVSQRSVVDVDLPPLKEALGSRKPGGARSVGWGIAEVASSANSAERTRDVWSRYSTRSDASDGSDGAGKAVDDMSQLRLQMKGEATAPIAVTLPGPARAPRTKRGAGSGSKKGEKSVSIVGEGGEDSGSVGQGGEAGKGAADAGGKGKKGVVAKKRASVAHTAKAH